MPEQTRVGIRVPLQVGTSALVGFCRAGASLVLVGALAWYGLWFAMAIAEGAVALLPILAVVSLPVLGGSGFVLIYAWHRTRLAWRERPSDLVIGGECFCVEGGQHHGLKVAWRSIDAKNIAIDAGYRRDLRLAPKDRLLDDEEPPNFWQLSLTVDRSPLELATCADQSELGSLESLRDALTALAAPEAESAAPPATRSDVLRCSRCGAAIHPAEAEQVACEYCASPVNVPAALRERLRTLREDLAARARTQERIAELLRQPAARRAGIWLALAAVPSVLASVLLAISAWLLFDACLIHAWGVALLVVAPLAISVAAFYLVRGRFADRAAFRLLSLGFAAAQSAYGFDCRACGAPLPESKGRLLVTCAYCDTDSVLNIALPRRSARERTEAQSLEAALSARANERARWAGGWALSLLLFLVLLAPLLRASRPHSITVLLPASDLERISYGDDDELNPRLSPDGSELLYDQRALKDRIMSNVARGGLFATRESDLMLRATRPAWLRGGSDFVFVDKDNVLRRSGPPSDRDSNSELFYMGIDPSTPSVSPDQTLVTYSTEWPKGAPSIHVRPLRAHLPNRQLTTGDPPDVAHMPGRWPAFSPDGTRIAFARLNGGHWQIATAHLDGSDLRELTRDACSHSQSAWSSDGRSLAYLDDCLGAWRLCVMRADGSNPRPLTQGTADVATPTWSKDALYFSANVAGNQNIFKLKLSGY